MRAFLLIAVLLVAACDDPDGAARVLQQQGYTEIRPTGFSFLGCGQDDLYRTSFEATAPNGERVTGVVCSAIFKGNTVRLD